MHCMHMHSKPGPPRQIPLSLPPRRPALGFPPACGSPAPTPREPEMILLMLPVGLAAAAVASSLAAAGAAAAAPPPTPPPPTVTVVSSVAPARVPTEGGGDIVVRGSGFCAASGDCGWLGTGTALCRLDPPPTNCGPVPCARHVLNTTAPSFPATVVSPTELVCHGVPAVAAGGPALLVVSLDGGKTFRGDRPVGERPAGSGNSTRVWDGRARNQTNRLEYFSLVEVYLDRRPYINETGGLLLLRTDRLALGAVELAVSAELPAGGPAAKWSWPKEEVMGGRELALPFDFGVLPGGGEIHNEMKITVSWSWLDSEQTDSAALAASDSSSPALAARPRTRSVTKFRRFHRVPPPVCNETNQWGIDGCTVEPVQVDYMTKGLLVGGRPFNGVGWYFYPDRIIKLEDIARLVQYELAPHGINQGMLYGFPGGHNLTVQRAFLDVCQKAGFKIMYSGRPEDHAGGLEAMKANVHGVKDHAAILGYCECASSARKCFCSVPNHHFLKRLLLARLELTVDSVAAGCVHDRRYLR
eukprot:SAG22_NODE_53_length_24242_cov_158.884231_15_plen_528_part_00